MSTHYLVDLFGNPLTSARILDVRSPPSGQSPVQGTLVIRVPDTIQVQNPTNLGDLIAKKHQGLLASYAGFAHMAYDDLLDLTGLDLAASGTGGTFGGRGVVLVAPGALVQTQAAPLTGTPSQSVVMWENFTYTDSDPATGTLVRTYGEVAPSPSVMTCQVSYNGGVSFQSVLSGAVNNIALPDQGSSLILRWTNQTAGKVGLGSWAVVY